MSSNKVVVNISRVEVISMVEKLESILINKNSVMSLLSMSSAGVFNVVKRGELGYVSIGGFKLYILEDVMKYKNNKEKIKELKNSLKVV